MKSSDIELQIKGVELRSFQFKPFEKELQPENIKFEVRIEQKMELTQNLVLVICTVTLTENHNTMLAEIKVDCLFFIKDLVKVSSMKKNNAKRKFMDDAINSIAISTTRGVLASETRGTYLNNIILPIIDPRKLEIGREQ